MVAVLRNRYKGGVRGRGWHRWARFGEARVSGSRGRRRRVGCLQAEATAGEGPFVLCCPAALLGGDGGVREFALLGPRDRRPRPRGETDCTGVREALREATEERCGRR